MSSLTYRLKLFLIRDFGSELDLVLPTLFKSRQLVFKFKDLSNGISHAYTPAQPYPSGLSFPGQIDHV